MNTTTTTCLLFPNETWKCDVIINIKRFTASLSLIGCLFTFFIIWVFKKYKVFSQRLVLCLSIAAFLSSIAYLAGEPYPAGIVCNFLGFFMTYADWSVILWVCCITFNLLMNVVRSENTRALRTEWIYHALCWVLPAVFATLPFTQNNYGPVGAWCWITTVPWRFTIWFVPVFIITIFLFIVYTYIIYRLHRLIDSWQGTFDPRTEQEKAMMREDVKPLRGYPFVFIAVSIFAFINRIHNAVHPNSPSFALYVLMVLTSPLKGALNAIVFCLDPETRKRLTPSQIKMEVLSRRTQSQMEDYPVIDREFTMDEQPDI